MDFDFSGKRLISKSVLDDISNAIREKYGTSDKIKPIDMADLIRGIGTEAEEAWYVWYMSNIAPIDGLYNSHSYSNLYVVGDELVVLYRSAPHHFSGPELVTMRCSRTNLKTWETTDEDVLVGAGINYWGSVFYDGVYYIFDQSKKRFTTTDFKNFEVSTYTAPASEPYYIVVGDNGRFISPHSNSQAKGTMMYSDDLGVTWAKSTGDDVYNATLTTHGATTKVGNTLVAYCQNQKKDSPTDNTTILNVLTSTDNGLTWVGIEAQDEDLKYCGPSFASGMFAQVGDEWWLAMSSRLRTNHDDGTSTVGSVRLFRGTSEDVLTGNMHLFAVVDEFRGTFSAAGSVTMTDTGNIGMTTDGKSLYIVYAKPMMEVTGTIPSNSMLALAVVNMSPINIGREDSYHNENWVTERDAFVSAMDAEHDLYIYANGDSVVTNARGISIATRGTYSGQFNNGLASGSVAPLTDLVIPFVNNLDIRMVMTICNRNVNGAYAQQYYGLNDGKKRGLCGSVNNFYFTQTSSGASAAPFAAANNQKIDFRIGYANGVVSATLNGDTIEDVQSYIVVETDKNPDVNTAMLAFGWAGDFVTANQNIGHALHALIIDTDGDISCLLNPSDAGGDGGDDSGETGGETGGGDEPEVIIENPVTEGLIHYFDVNDVADTTWNAKVGDRSLTISSYDSDTKFVVPGKNFVLDTNANLGINTETGMAFEIVTNLNTTGSVLKYSPNGADMLIEYSIGGGGGIFVAGTLHQKLTNHFWMNKTLHTVFNLDVENGNAEIYINGELKETVSAELTFTESYMWALSAFGSTGKMGSFRIYDRPLTAEEVANNYKYESYSYDFTEV